MANLGNQSNTVRDYVREIPSLKCYSSSPWNRCSLCWIGPLSLGTNHQSALHRFVAGQVCIYADDAALFVRPTISDDVIHVRLLLQAFGTASGLMTNIYKKSELYHT